FDYDLDGWLDFLTTNGHIEQEISRIQKSQNYAQPAKLYWNSRGRGGVGAFVPVPYEKVGTPLAKPLVGRGSAFGDLDADGDLDVVMTQAAGLPVILRNDQSLGHNWIRVRLEGRQSNRDAIGAWVTVRLPGRTMHRQVMPCRGYLSSSELPVTIGLGRESAIREVTVAWPGFPGKATTHPVALNTLTVIHQPEM
ncbi:MAG: CRTAC1 family protein, partial [Verrucomicrobia bacterium]|nr:CRTAC1 family protein [Verrucomicrobiota bacterium]